ncbi:MAG: rhodanese-like domain-containing protein [Cyclobacteriaceae bacterium]|nr:rhodanese-like domain-containing protein [Cyclobacteriaceae bacterium]
MGLLDLLGFGKRKEQLREALSNGAVIIDVRTKGEFSSGNIKGSQNIPLDKIRGQVERIKKMNKPVIVCCASGMRSGSAKSILKSSGVECYNGGGWHSLNSL